MRAAQTLLAAGHHADAVDRAYAGMLQSARAALVLDGLNPVSEDDLVNRFRLQFSKSGRIEGTGSEMVDARGISEGIRTGDGADVDEVRARRLLEFATQVLSAVGEAIRAKQIEGAAQEAGTRDISQILPGTALTPEKEDLVRQLDDAFKGERRMVLRYLQDFGWSKVVAPNIRAVREAVLKEDAALKGVAETPEANGEGKDPCYVVQAKCLFCDGPEFETRMLRGKVVQTKIAFETPEYPLLVEDPETPLKGYKFADPLHFAAHVCPSCLFASTSLLHFRTTQALAGENIADVLGTKRIEKLKEALDRSGGQRRDVVQALNLVGPGPVAQAFGPGRGPREARAALELAALSAESESEFLANALFDAGQAYLRAARLSRDLPDRRTEEYLGRALRAFQDGYLKTTHVAQTAYLLGVLFARMGQWRDARIHVGRILTDRKLNDRVRYKVWAENLHEHLRAKIAEEEKA